MTTTALAGTNIYSIIGLLVAAALFLGDENMATKKATLQQIRDAWNQWEADRKMAWQVLVEIGDIGS